MTIHPYRRGIVVGRVPRCIDERALTGKDSLRHRNLILRSYPFEDDRCRPGEGEPPEIERRSEEAAAARKNQVTARRIAAIIGVFDQDAILAGLQRQHADATCM